MKNNYPKATQQDPLVEIFPNIYLLRGSIQVMPLLQINRNMIIIKQHDELTLINAVRMTDQNLEHLEQLGQIKHVIRLGDFHGLDDAFYLHRYQPTFWSQKNHIKYPKLQPHRIISQDVNPPIPNSQFVIFEQATHPEAALLLKDHQLLITTDSVQYWQDWKFFTPLSIIIMWLMGFRLKLFIGGPWRKLVSRHKNSLKPDFERILTLDFKHLISAHGTVRKEVAKIELAQVVKKTFKD